MEQTTRKTYQQNWTEYNQAQCGEVNTFDALLRDLTRGIPEPEYTFGRPSLSIQEALFCTIQKVYARLSSRRAKSLYDNATEKELLEHAPHFNTASKLLNREDVTPILHELIAITAKPLQSVDTNFAVDSSGFQTTRFGEYCKTKHGETKKHSWLKCHIVTGVKTNIITAVEITHNNSNDCPKLPTLMKATANQGFTISEVTADKAYSSRVNYDTVQQLGGQAYIPFKSNASGHSHGSPMWKKMFHFFQLHEEEFMTHYHKRSNVETTFFMLKAKFGDYLRSKNPTALENELLCKIVCHNICVLIQELHIIKKPEV